MATDPNAQGPVVLDDDEPIWRPTPEILDAVLRVYRDTAKHSDGAIVTVKSPEVGQNIKDADGRPRFLDVKPWGRRYFGPNDPHHRWRYRRAIRMYFRGSKGWPNGIPIGVTQVEQQDGLPEFGGSTSYTLIEEREDVSRYEISRLKEYAEGRYLMSEMEIRADARRKEQLRRGAAMEDLEPNVKDERLAAAIAKAVATVVRSGGGATEPPKRPVA